MTAYYYGAAKPHIEKRDLSAYFNRYRVQKYILDTLIQLGKTHFDDYKVLEPGCGAGDKLRFMTEWGVRPENCYGLDCEESAIEYSRKLSPANMNLQVGDVFNMPFERNTFDIVMTSGLFGCFQNNNDVLNLAAALDRVLKDGGVLLVADLNENYESFYAENEAVLDRNLRGYNTAEKQLENLMFPRFRCVLQRPMFATESYVDPSGEPMGAHQFPFIDHGIETGEVECAYSFWAFIKE